MTKRVRTVAYDPDWGWIARCPNSGEEIMEAGFRWRTRDVARTVVDEHVMLGCECSHVAERSR